MNHNMQLSIGGQGAGPQYLDARRGQMGSTQDRVNHHQFFAVSEASTPQYVNARRTMMGSAAGQPAPIPAAEAIGPMRGSSRRGASNPRGRGTKTQRVQTEPLNPGKRARVIFPASEDQDRQVPQGAPIQAPREPESLESENERLRKVVKSMDGKIKRREKTIITEREQFMKLMKGQEAQIKVRDEQLKAEKEQNAQLKRSLDNQSKELADLVIKLPMLEIEMRELKKAQQQGTGQEAAPVVVQEAIAQQINAQEAPVQEGQDSPRVIWKLTTSEEALAIWNDMFGGPEYFEERYRMMYQKEMCCRLDLSSFFFNPKDSQLPQKPRTRGQSGYVLHGKFGRGNWNPLSAEQKQEWNQIHHLIGVIQVEQANAGFIRVLEGNQNL